MMKRFITTVYTASQRVFGIWQYWIVFVVTVAILLFITVLLSQYQFIRSIIISDLFPLDAKWGIILSSFGSFQTNLTRTDQIFALAVALLSGITIAMVVYYFKQRLVLEKAAGTSIFGIVVGLFGIGCSACGSVVISTVFGIGAAGSFLVALPFDGVEINILSIAILCGSSYMIAKKITTPVVCDVSVSSSYKTLT